MVKDTTMEYNDTPGQSLMLHWHLKGFDMDEMSTKGVLSLAHKHALIIITNKKNNE